MKAFYTYSKGSQGNRSLTAFVQVNAFNRVVLKKDVTEALLTGPTFLWISIFALILNHKAKVFLKMQFLLEDKNEHKTIRHLSGEKHSRISSTPGNYYSIIKYSYQKESDQ